MFGIAPFVTLVSAAALAAPALAAPAKRQTIYSGDGTYFDVALGACGITNVATDMVVAVSELMYDTWPGATANPNLNPICGNVITAFYGGNQVTVTVVDRCTACAYYDLDFSRGAFDLLASEDAGRIQITWEWDSGSGISTTATPTSTSTTPTPTTTSTTPTPTTTSTTPAPTTTSTTTTSAPATTTTAASSGSCSGVAAWSSSVAYTTGEEVTYNGHLWSAKYWTEADAPGGVAGDWTDDGAC